MQDTHYREKLEIAVRMAGRVRAFGRKDVTSGMVLDMWADLAAGRDVDNTRPEHKMIRGLLEHQRVARPDLFSGA